MNLNESSISNIETFLTENRNLLDAVDLPEYYKNAVGFKFLPGHKLCLVQLAQKCTSSNGDKRNETQKQNTVHNEKELSEEVITNNTEKKLIEKLLTFSTTRKLCLNSKIFSEASLKNVSIIIENGNITGKCNVQCPSCTKSIPVNLNKYWFTGNFQKHIKEHGQTTAINDDSVNVIAEDDTDSNISLFETGDNQNIEEIPILTSGLNRGNSPHFFDVTRESEKRTLNRVSNDSNLTQNGGNLEKKINECLNNLLDNSASNQFLRL